MAVCNECNAEETKSYAHAKCDRCGLLLCLNCSKLTASELKGVTVKERSPCVRYNCKNCILTTKDELVKRADLQEMKIELEEIIQRSINVMMKSDKMEKVIKQMEIINKEVNNIKNENGKIKTKIDEISKLVQVNTKEKEKPKNDAGRKNENNNKKQNRNEITLSQVERAVEEAREVVDVVNEVEQEEHDKGRNQRGDGFYGVRDTSGENSNIVQSVSPLIGVPNKKWYFVSQASETSTCQSVIAFLRD